MLQFGNAGQIKAETRGILIKMANLHGQCPKDQR